MADLCVVLGMEGYDPALLCAIGMFLPLQPQNADSRISTELPSFLPTCPACMAVATRALELLTPHRTFRLSPCPLRVLVCIPPPPPPHERPHRCR